MKLLDPSFAEGLRFYQDGPVEEPPQRKARYAYRIGREVFPKRSEMALGAAGLAAFIPEFLFISGAINDDNGAALFGALALWAMVRILRRGFSLSRGLGLGLVLGLGLLSKLTVIALLPSAGARNRVPDIPDDAAG